jgi:haloalkane dehalogenase
VAIGAEDNHPRRRVSVLDTEISFVDAGEGVPIVFLHGNPTSSYLWRNVIPHTLTLGRCLAPDLVGMGRSGKSPENRYRFADHARYLDEWFAKLNLGRDVTLVLHDWGSALGFNWAHRHPNAVRAIVYMEAIVRPRRWEDFPKGRDAMFRAFRSAEGEHLILDDNAFIEVVMPRSILRSLSDTEMDAYREPFGRRCSSEFSEMRLHSDGSEAAQGEGVLATRTSDPTTVTAGASMRMTRHLATSTPDRAATRVAATAPPVAINNHAWKA